MLTVGTSVWYNLGDFSIFFALSVVFTIDMY